MLYSCVAYDGLAGLSYDCKDTKFCEITANNVIISFQQNTFLFATYYFVIGLFNLSFSLLMTKIVGLMYYNIGQKDEYAIVVSNIICYFAYADVA